MPKVKTNSGAKKRFSFTGTGKVKRRHAYHSSDKEDQEAEAQLGRYNNR